MITGAIHNLFPDCLPVKASVGDSARDSEDILLRKGQTGDRMALGLLLTPHTDPLLRLCRGILGSPDEAEDAVQETFLRALRALAKPGGFRGDAAFSTWLFRIAVRVCLDRRRERSPLENRDAAMLEGFADAKFPPIETAVVNRLAIAQALAELPPRQRVLIVLREQEGWSAREIADALGWNEKRVHNELFKARQRLLRLRMDGVTGGDE